MGTDKRARQKELRGTRLAEARHAAESAQRKRRIVNITLLVAAAAALVAVIVVFSRDDTTKSAAGDPGDTTTTSTAPLEPTKCPEPDGSSPKTQSFASAPPMCIDPAKTYTAEVDTSAGSFTLALNPAKAPNTVNNFVVLARYHFYDGVTFHRIIDDFVIQGGDPEGTGSGGPGYKFADELPAPSDYTAGSVVMANSGPDTNGSQFFVVLSDNGAKQLVEAVGGKANYSLFGQVTSGMDVVSAIGSTPVNGDAPIDPPVINSVTITEA